MSRAKDIIIVGQVGELHYHNVPSDLERITLSPEKEAVFRYLTRISYDQFPHFIKDILVQVFGHKLVDVTDGSGDEGQDILTLFDGKRCLTQCKHTANPATNYSGDESDKLFAACFRKNCTLGILVTNTDLTIQAKRYFTDKEYARSGSVENIPELDYWNGDKIWGAVSKSKSILNKWFSGMAQAHGLRQFSFYVVAQKCPTWDSGKWSDNVISSLLAATGGSADATEVHLEVTKDFSLRASTWFRSDINLGIPYLSSLDPDAIGNIPLRAMKVDLQVSDKVQQYSPASYITTALKYVAEHLPVIQASEWWHIVATPAESIVYFQETNLPTTLAISAPQRFVKANGVATLSEDEWLRIDSDQFEKSDDDGLEWRHKDSDANVSLVVDVKPNPISAYEQFIVARSQLKRIEKHKFRCISQATTDVVDRVRHLSGGFNWPVLLASNGDLFWAFPPEDEENQKKAIEDILGRQGVLVQRISEKGRQKILERIETSPAATSLMTSRESELVFPINLDQRIIQVILKTDSPRPSSTDVWLKVLQFKWSYEHEHGYDAFHGKKQKELASEEIRGQLFDPYSHRGPKMLDVGFGDGKLTIYLRLRLSGFQTLLQSAQQAVEDAQQLAKSVGAIVAPPSTPA